MKIKNWNSYLRLCHPASRDAYYREEILNCPWPLYFGNLGDGGKSSWLAQVAVIGWIIQLYWRLVSSLPCPLTRARRIWRMIMQIRSKDFIFFLFLKLLFSIRNFPISSLFLFLAPSIVSAVNYHMINLLMSQPVAKYSANVILLSSY